MKDLAAQLARDGGEPDRMGRVYAARAYPCLDVLSPPETYSLGFRDGVRAALGLFAEFLSSVIDPAEVMARLCDPDVLPLPDAPPAAEPAEA